MRFAVVWTFAALLLVVHVAPAHAWDFPPVRLCFVDNPSTVVSSDYVDQFAIIRKVATYLLRVRRGQHLKIELQPQNGPQGMATGLQAALAWPDGSKQEENGTRVFDGEVRHEGDLVIRIATVSKGQQHFTLTVTADLPATDCSAGERLERFVNQTPDKLWKAEPDLERRLRKLLGKKYPRYAARNITKAKVKKGDDALVIDSCKSTWGEGNLAEVFISVPDGKLHCLLLYDGERTELFSEDPQHLPAEVVKAQSVQ